MGRHRVQTTFSLPSCQQGRYTLDFSSDPQTKHLSSLAAMLTLQGVDLVNDLVRVHVVHHGTEGYGFHVDARAGEAAVAEVFLDHRLGFRAHLDDITDDGILSYFLFLRDHRGLLNFVPHT